LRGADVRGRRLRRVRRLRIDRGEERGGAGARRSPLGPAADDRHRRPGLLRVARGSETLRAVEHRLRPDSAARAAGEEQEGPQHRDFRARAHGFGPLVRDHLKAFLEHLRLNENASAHTVRAYESDLSQYLAFLATHASRRVSELTAAHLDHLGARAFMAELNKRGNAKASAARKLSAIRAFGRYLRREGVIDSDPAALVGTPRLEL